MNPDDIVLVALVNHIRDLELAEKEHWYRIPERRAPKFFSGAQYVAFYLASAFGDRKWSICEYADVRGHELVKRRDLIPEEPDHERADDQYFKLQIGPLVKREPPIVSRRGRRILFLWTSWEKFSKAQEINDLFQKGVAQDRLWRALKECDLDTERQVLVREGKTRYRVDFLIYCPNGRVGVSIGQGRVAAIRRRDYRAISITEDELENHFSNVLDRITLAAHDLAVPFMGSKGPR